jgi:DtxR family Mn-dependent transcriptional regulator
MNKTAVLLSSMQTDGLLTIADSQLHLTTKGRDSALHIIRAHRLWERYLAEETGYDEADWHGRAELREHEMTTADLDALATRLGNPTHDPHGDPIPRADGEMVMVQGQPLPTITNNTSARIIHLEDEPPIVYAQLIAEGLHPGMKIRMMESTNERVRFWSNGDEHLLAPIVANNITVQPLPNHDDIKADETNYRFLSNLKPGESGTVAGIVPSCRGPERRRFMDLGILRGTTITAEMSSPGGDPMAYLIRGALIALRKNQAKQIRIKE